MNANEILGDYNTRYFGAGHKNTFYCVDGCMERKEFYEGVGQIEQVKTWSEKNNVSLKQHLSTLDCIILATMLVEKYLISKRYNNISSIFLYEFEVKSGNCSIEKLDEIKLMIKSFELRSDELYFVVQVGNMQIKLLFRNSISKWKHKKKSKVNLEAVHYFSNHLKDIRHDIINVKYMEEELQCEVVRKKLYDRQYNGVSALGIESTSILEWLVIFSQMSQILAYKYDDIERQNSNTLWMKSVKARILEEQVAEASFQATGEITGAKIVKKVQFEGKIVHKLPKKEEEYL